MRSDYYQYTLIFLGIVVAAFFSVFVFREIFPEYKIYQNIYWDLEEFRSTYTGEPPPPFEFGIKQILLEADDKGDPTIDRCVSCHVAVQFEHFSPTKIAYDINGNMRVDKEGLPVQVENEEYIWTKVDEKIASLLEQGKEGEAQKYKNLKSVEVGEHTYDVTKALRMHPLIGRETRPFEYHPIDEYGCTSCHNGNDRGLTTQKAHGPVFDGQYEEQFMGPEPVFLESDSLNDPLFSKVFNHKPGHELLFQTTPLFVGSLIQAKCVQCHRTSQGILEDVAQETSFVTARREEKAQAIQQAYQNEKEALQSLLDLRARMKANGYTKTLDAVRILAEDYTLPPKKRQTYQSQLDYILLSTPETILIKLNKDTERIAGTTRVPEDIDAFIQERPNEKGTIFSKAEAVTKDQEHMRFVKEAEKSISAKTAEENILLAIPSEIDFLIEDYHRGKELYLSQACYACHRINGLTRGGVGPELTFAGQSYPWFLKESIVWPQADLKTSTMPNFKLDHEEVEDLVTFLLAQHGRSQATSETAHRSALLKWEAGAKLPWEKPINPGDLKDLRYSMTVFATQGCAACHRLEGYQSNVGYRVENENEGDLDFETRFKESEWFQGLIREFIPGSQLVKVLEEHAEEIDRRIVDGVREGSLLEEIEEKYPHLIESFYTSFKYAMRAKNHQPDEVDAWRDRVRRVLMVFIQEYGLGRVIGPRPNWSGIYRSDEWLMEHFRKPSSHIARSIMPVLPFDDSKFYALTYMLDVLAIRNRDRVRQIWDNRGFDPELAYDIHCAQCHGKWLHGNGPVSEWIYPIPKNLRNADFLRNFTKENVVSSIVHGVKGTPMPPWGEVATDKPMADGIPVLTESEIRQIVDWLFASLLGGEVIKGIEDVPKWQYSPRDAIEEIESEGNVLKPGPPPEFLELREPEPDLSLSQVLDGSEFIVSIDPVITQKPDAKVAEVFDIYPNPLKGLEKYNYYIKKKYFTEENIKAGQSFFSLNCSVCHGIEADGQGFRAGSMFDAKPRMLTNLHWIDTRDDLRLLRSIKYGVTGTSMTPWGDQTSALQRMQLVIYIRSLSLEQGQRDELFNTLYEIFDRADQTIDMARVEEYTTINQLTDQLNAFKAERASLDSPEEAVRLYGNELKLLTEIQKHKDSDALLQQIKILVQEEKQTYQILGIQLIGKTIIGDTFETYLKALSLDNANYSEKEGKLAMTFSLKKEKEIDELKDQLVAEMKQEIQRLEKEKMIVKGKISSDETRERLAELNSDLNGFVNLRNELISGFEQAKRLRQQQQKLYTLYTENE